MQLIPLSTSNVKAPIVYVNPEQVVGIRTDKASTPESPQSFVDCRGSFTYAVIGTVKEVSETLSPSIPGLSGDSGVGTSGPVRP